MAIGGIPHFQTHPQGTMVFRRLSKADHGRLLIVVEALPGYTRNVIIALGDISGIGICLLFKPIYHMYVRVALAFEIER